MLKATAQRLRYSFRTCALVGPMVVVASAAHAQATAEHDELFMFAMIVAVCSLVIYVIPTIVAFSRHHPNRWPIAVINIALGGTGLGWLGSLVWACSAVHRSPTGNHGGESGLNLFVNDRTPIVMLPGHEPQTIEQLSANLLKLKTLYEAGALSADEYQRLRAPLLKLI